MGWYERWAGWSERYRFLVDLSLTVLAGLVAVPGALSLYADRFDSTWLIVSSILVLAPLAWCRTRPVASCIAIFVACMLQLWVFDLPVIAADFAAVVSVYCVTVYGPRWAYRMACGMAAFGSVALGLSLSMSVDSLLLIIPTAAVLACAFAFGLVRRSRRAMLVAMRDRTERLEIERDQQAQIATAAERARIAREMHDIVAHSLSVVIAQADGGRYAAAADPAAAERALGTIAETGRAALADMRRLLGVLREGPGRGTTPLGLVAPDDTSARPPLSALGAGPGAGAGAGPSAGPGARPGAGSGTGLPGAARGTGGPGATRPAPAPSSGSVAPLRPQPDAADISDLVDQARDDGLRVSWARVGVERRLPPGVGLTLFRICQEALTNVRKHAGPRPAVTIMLRWGEDEVELRVEDDGRGLAADSSPGPEDPVPAAGYGLLGMRERAEMFGGTLTAGPRRGGGFSVRFVVPIPRSSDSPPRDEPDAGQPDPAPEQPEDRTAQAVPNDTRGAR
ncbi:histidine kinase/DNA gyrase B/HSP90-like ATPase [Promicromonospora sp. AC04]|uniref:sensor histidine kinase n=1 Tax=Promicromonospora sp. AC04 TaxID=2135723 RepID=UPI000D3DA605|nr:histidine kinase [Promicromonospora sp. AC04]PUB19803.1 histidine kinase/DNA gyrase B/HSP90-like ATPase [Promicromonospora sp. AC04]